MKEENYIALLKQGKNAWNEVRQNDYSERANFNDTSFDDFNFEGYNLNNCHFYKVSLQNCNFNKTDICWSSFLHCNLANSTIINPDRRTYSEETSFQGVNLRWTAFGNCDLQNVNLKGALFESVHLHDCNLNGANISFSRIHGLSAWGNIVDESTIQTDLIVTPFKEPTITVDNFEIAQFLYLIITNKKLRSVIDTLSTKVVLILGCFSSENKEILDKIKHRLNYKNYVPVVFDFDKPNSRNLTETVSTIAHLSKFVIADLTNPRSAPHELASINPLLKSVPIIPIIKEGQVPYSMVYDLNNISELLTYRDDNINELVEQIISQADSK
ncbi:MAG: pentapeptide repeat-containing protein [Chitinophagaceae bacterium]|nr:pentapeptide repeat-containing protein [Chitinophagaceae bacterium]